jgi:hypothetical protein
MSYLLSVPADEHGFQVVEERRLVHLVNQRTGERRSYVEHRVADPYRLAVRWEIPPQVGGRLPPLEWD